MTVIAWDGKTLAADKPADAGGYKYKVKKILKYKGELLFSAGYSSSIHALYQWYKAGAKPEDYPKSQDDKENWAALHVIKLNGTLWRYEQAPYPWQVQSKFFAIGSGRDYAIAAMHCGKSSVEAVRIASLYEINCGMGVDTLKL